MNFKECFLFLLSRIKLFIVFSCCCSLDIDWVFGCDQKLGGGVVKCGIFKSWGLLGGLKVTGGLRYFSQEGCFQRRNPGPFQHCFLAGDVNGYTYMCSFYYCPSSL